MSEDEKVVVLDEFPGIPVWDEITISNAKIRLML